MPKTAHRLVLLHHRTKCQFGTDPVKRCAPFYASELGVKVWDKKGAFHRLVEMDDCLGKMLWLLRSVTLW